MPGYKKFELYPHDMNKAKALIKQANPSDRNITVWTDNESPNDDAGAYYQDLLKKLGFDAKLKIINADNYFTVIGNLSTPDLDTGWADWFEDYPHPNDFFEPLLARGQHPADQQRKLRPDRRPVAEQEDRPARHAAARAVAGRSSTRRSTSPTWSRRPGCPTGTRTLSTFVSSAIDLDKVIWNPTFEDDLTSFQFK